MSHFCFSSALSIRVFALVGLTKILNCIKESIIFDSVALQTIEWQRANKIKMGKNGGGWDGGKCLQARRINRSENFPSLRTDEYVDGSKDVVF